MARARVSLLAATYAVILFLSLNLILPGDCSSGGNSRTHVVGDDRGWDPSSDVASWATGRIFLVGDYLWFAYSAAQERMVELGSKDEYEACDLRNPIMMYTDGLSKVALDGEGTRYFASGNPESCKKGLKLPIEVKPKSEMAPGNVEIQQGEVASAPSSPSGAGRVCGGAALGLGALLGGVLLI